MQEETAYHRDTTTWYNMNFHCDKNTELSAMPDDMDWHIHRVK